MLIQAGDIRTFPIDIESLLQSVDTLRGIVDAEKAPMPGTRGAKAYDIHVQQLMRRARKNPRIGIMIRGWIRG